MQVLKSESFNKPIIVVGNLSVGGTGKTPFISSLVEYLKSRQFSVGIVSRGYGANIKIFPHQISPDDTAEAVGDEPLMQARKLNVPIVISPNRAQAVNYLLSKNNVDVVISDDGLQHYAMSRDIEIVLFDGAREFGNRLILPFGPLREPVSRLKSVDFVVQNGTQNSFPVKYKSQLIEVALVNIASQEERPLDYLSEHEVVAVAGIGNPQRFFSSLEKFVAIKSKSIYPDHHAFQLKDFDHIHEDKLVVMTEKDAVKCEAFAKKNWFYLKIRMEVESSLFSEIEKSIKIINEQSKLLH